MSERKVSFSKTHPIRLKNIDMNRIFKKNCYFELKTCQSGLGKHIYLVPGFNFNFLAKNLLRISKSLEISKV